jgi:hypothetical protein
MWFENACKAIGEKAAKLKREVVAVHFDSQVGDDKYDFAIVLCVISRDTITYAHEVVAPEWTCWEWSFSRGFSRGVHGSYDTAYAAFVNRVKGE